MKRNPLERKVYKSTWSYYIRVDNNNIGITRQEVEQGFKDYNGIRYILVNK